MMKLPFQTPNEDKVLDIDWLRYLPKAKINTKLGQTAALRPFDRVFGVHLE